MLFGIFFEDMYANYEGTNNLKIYGGVPGMKIFDMNQP
jgi:hypothetical protein